ncbi:actin-related protein 9-like [Lolium rigidum]|uniref:actin-related protein 9-like n=1 Tax=Lolium rigidum TaxID=89674 RepID=UPI001F5D31B5|nr:actin-related protein 9-like [Lolium rigidum]
MGRVDGISSQQNKDDNKLNWTDVLDRSIKSSTSIESSDADEDPSQSTSDDGNRPNSEEIKYKEMIFGEDALKIPPSAPYCLSRPIRRGHFNISQNYQLHQEEDADVANLATVSEAKARARWRREEADAVRQVREYEAKRWEEHIRHVKLEIVELDSE